MIVRGRDLFAVFLLCTIASASAAVPQADRVTLDDLKSVDEIIVVWEPGKASTVIPKIAEAGFTVRPGLDGVPFGVCPIPDGMTAEQLNKLQNIEEIQRVVPNVTLKIPVD